jgi:serine protease Do
MNNKGLFKSAALAALCAASAAVGSYTVVRAEAVDPHAVAAPIGGAPASFADIVARVAPAVVSIDVEGKAKRQPTVFSFGPGGPGAQVAPDGQGGGDDGDDNDDSDGADGGGGPGAGAAPNGVPPGFPFDFRQFFGGQQPGVQAPPQKMRATGSGFFISADGYILTNNHVVEDADKITVRTTDDRKLDAHLVGRDPATDLAVIKVEGTGHPFVDFENRSKPRVGDWVVAVGNPYNLGGTATAGIVSALSRPRVSGSNYVDYMQIDAPINRGNSGGPTFDLYGRVVGVNSAIFSPSGGSVGIGFDIPADVAQSISKQLIAGGKVTRGYIGATVQDVTPEIAESLGIPGQKGALVAQVSDGGPSAAAGLRSGDLVLSVDGHPVASAADLTRQVALAHAGEALQLKIRRDGRVQEVAVRSGVRPSDVTLARADTPAPEAHGRVLGMSLSANPQGGVTIEGVANGSSAGDLGLQRGDVIMRAGDTATRTPQDVSAAVASARKDGRKAVLLLVAHQGQRLYVPLTVEKQSG